MKLNKSIKPQFLKINFRNPLLYVLLAIKLITVLLLNYFGETNFQSEWSKNTLLATYSGDSHAYIKPIDNFIEEGDYYFIEANGKEYAGRAPYYGSIYYLIRQFSDKYTALDLLAFIQILIDCLAGLVMALIVYRITSKSWAYWLTIGLYIFSFHQTDYSGRILTESLSCSALIFSTYYFMNLFNDKTKRNYFLSGFWLSIAVVLKPYFAPLYIGIFLFYNKSKSVKYNFLCASIFVSSLIFIILPFTIRNYVRFDTVQPFSKFDGGSGITDGEYAFRKYMKAIGEPFIFWDPDGAGCLFTIRNVPCNYKLPARVYTKNTDSLKIMQTRDLYVAYLNSNSSDLEKTVINQFDSLTQDYKQSRPFMYYAGSRGLLLSSFIIQKASYYIPNSFSGMMRHLVNSLKILQYFMYYLITITGFAGLIFWVRKHRKISIILGSIPVFIILLFPILLGATEWRFWTTAHYFLLMSSVLFFYYLTQKSNNYN